MTVPVDQVILLKSSASFDDNDMYSLLDAHGNEIVTGKAIKKYGQILAVGVNFLQRGFYFIMVRQGEAYSMNSFVKV